MNKEINYIINFLNDSNILLVLGLILQLIGGILVSLEAFGIKEYMDYIESDNESNKRHALLELNWIFNNIAVFLFVNLIWFTTLALIFKLPIKVCFILYLFGYFIWKILIVFSKKASSIIYNLIPKYNKDKSIIMQLQNVIISLSLLIIFAAVSLLSMFIEFGLDIPFRYISEKYISKGILYIFKKTYKIITNMKHSMLKKPIIIGILFVLLGFIYQFLGTILS
ncbi:hypothetical protein [Clostridium gasigenes]|uniref:hypothetical protein n=1 Tax=Clostridium gasigenes TaxID=94869 RepID=UPI001C0CBC82|nr:hypothetical protein [Clostridium gasigenes]MBU3103068.1 hypothetical protein [Clostridium gasigenes]